MRIHYITGLVSGSSRTLPGDVYIYEVPLLSEGAVQSASSVKLWSPLASTAAAVHHVEGMAYADGHLPSWAELEVLFYFIWDVDSRWKNT